MNSRCSKQVEKTTGSPDRWIFLTPTQTFTVPPFQGNHISAFNDFTEVDCTPKLSLVQLFVCPESSIKMVIPTVLKQLVKYHTHEAMILFQAPTFQTGDGGK